MNHILLLAYPAALVIFTCFHARLTRGGRVSDGFLSLEQTHMIQAFACIGVILHHVTQQITAYGIYDKGPISLFNDIGILFTALFFFFSGYGLITSLQENLRLVKFREHLIHPLIRDVEKNSYCV